MAESGQSVRFDQATQIERTHAPLLSKPSQRPLTKCCCSHAVLKYLLKCKAKSNRNLSCEFFSSLKVLGSFLGICVQKRMPWFGNCSLPEKLFNRVSPSSVKKDLRWHYLCFAFKCNTYVCVKLCAQFNIKQVHFSSLQNSENLLIFCCFKGLNLSSGQCKTHHCH